MNAFSFYKLEEKKKNYKKNFESDLVAQYNRNRSHKDHITSIDEINLEL